MIPDYVLKAIRDKRVIILEDGTVYDRENIPLELLDPIDEWILEIRELIVLCDTRLCPAPDLHRKEWYHDGQQRYRCAVCQRLQESTKGDEP